MLKNEDLSRLYFKISDVVLIMLINVTMPTIVGISPFMSMIKSMLSRVEHEKIITYVPGEATPVQNVRICQVKRLHSSTAAS